MFYLDPDFRREPRGKGPWCPRCQQTVDTSKAVAVTVDHANWRVLEGHNVDTTPLLNFAALPGANPAFIKEEFMGRDCFNAIKGVEQ